MPTTTLNIANDYLLFDNYLTVSLTSQDGDTTVTSKRAIKETISEQSAPVGAGHGPTITCRWHVFVTQLTTFIPQPHGYLTDEDGVKHYIDSVELASWDTRYVLTTTAQAGAVLAV